MEEQSITIETNGLTPEEVDEVAALVENVKGIGSVRHRMRKMASLEPFELHASAAPHIAALVVTFAAGQLVPGVQEFTKAVGKKVGDAVGDVIAEWFKRKFPKPDSVEGSVTILNVDGNPIQKLKGRR